jgi:serine/threonine protein kinase/tetratricopeptide (TPR) repeat protein
MGIIVSIEIEQYISHYKILEKLGEGGMGVVYKALDTSLNRNVALKFLPSHLVRDKSIRKRFIVEAQAASALDHSNICNIHEINETEDGQLYICMSYYKGASLRQIIKKGSIPVFQTVNTILQIAVGLKAAHDEKIIHRDLKPGNIIITDKGEAKIVDFGLAKLAGENLTESYSTKGTIAYMAPELIRGLPGDQRSDIWSLGVVLYEMLTGYLPFKGAFPEPMMYAIVNKEPELLSHYLKDVPEKLQTIINRILQKDPEERYQSLEELFQDLEPLSIDAVLIREESFHHFVIRTFRKKKIRFVFAPTLVLLTIIFLIVLFKPVIFREVFHTGPPLIALISFENQTGDNVYDIWEKGIPNLLITKLQQSGGLRVTSWERLHDLKKQLGKEDVDFIDLNLGIQLCRQEGIAMIVTGTLFKAGETFATDVKVLDVDSKTILKSASAQGEGEGSILRSQVDILSKEITRGLGFTSSMMAALQNPVSNVTTTSNEAYKYFIQGNELKAKWRFSEARPFYELAIKHDSTFALAYYQLGKWIYLPLGLHKKSEKALSKAMKYLEQASDQESLGWKWDYYLHRNIDKSDSLIKEYIEKYGLDKKAHYRLGCIHRIKKEYKQAIEEFNEVLRLDPEHGSSKNQLGYCYLFQGNYQQALDYFKKGVASSPENANTYDCLADAYRGMGDIERMISSLKQGYTIDPKFPWAAEELVKSYAFKEDYNLAMEWTRRLNVPFQNRPDYPLYFKGLYNFLQGRMKQALIDLDMAIQLGDSLSQAQNIETHIPAIGQIVKAWIYYEMGQFEEGRKALHMIPSRYIELGYQLYIHKYEAMVHIQDGRLDSAKYHHNAYYLVSQDTTKFNVWHRNLYLFLYNLMKIEILLVEDSIQLAFDLFRQIQFDDWDIFILERREHTLLPFQQNLTARALLKMGNLDEAIEEYKRLTSEDPRIRGWQFIPAKYHYILGMLYEKKGWPGKAIDRYKHFLAVWQNADPDIPELIDTQIRLDNLRNR